MINFWHLFHTKLIISWKIVIKINGFCHSPRQRARWRAHTFLNRNLGREGVAEDC